MRIDHIGIAVDDLELAQKKFETVFQCTFSQENYVKNQSVKVSFAELDNVKIELVQATSSQSPLYPIMPHPILNFLEKNGWGLHHISFAVSDIYATLKQLSSLGFTSIEKEPVNGAHGLVAFLNPTHFNGLLIEISEV